MAWHVDEGLAVLVAAWKRRHPGAVVGTIGDASHAAGTSDHNPEKGGPLPGQTAGEVDAADFMPGPGGVTMTELRELRRDLLQSRDARLAYLIIDREIVSSTVQPWIIRPYHGTKHGHLHVSVNDRFRSNTDPWGAIMDQRPLTWRQIDGVVPELRLGDEDVPGHTQWVWRVQRLLGVESDNVYGPITARALQARMANDSTRSSADGSKCYLPEWRRLYGLWA